MKDTCKIEFDVGQTQFIDTGVKDYNKLTISQALMILHLKVIKL